MEIPYGYCHCGCGQKTKIVTSHGARGGLKRGEPLRFIFRHNRKNLFNHKYKTLYMPDHPHCQKGGKIYEHIVIAEKALGKILPRRVSIHHFPSIKSFTHLVICQDEAYHQLLHTRYRALIACGNSNWRKCFYCKIYDDPNNLSNHRNTFYHRPCKAYYERFRKMSPHSQSLSGPRPNSI